MKPASRLVVTMLGLAALAMPGWGPAAGQTPARKASPAKSRHALPPKEPVFMQDSFAPAGSFAPEDSAKKSATFAAPGSYAPANSFAPAGSFAPPDSFALRITLAPPACFAPADSFAPAGSFAQ